MPLRRANALMEAGEFAQASRLFDRLAVGARRQGMPIRAANLALRSAQAYLAQDDVDTALDRTRRAFSALVSHGQGQRAAQIISRLDAGLRERSYGAQADELMQFARRVLGETGLSLDGLKASHSAQVAEARGSLPARCEGCGAPLVPSEVSWHDRQTAECLYCGTVIKTA